MSGDNHLCTCRREPLSEGRLRARARIEVANHTRGIPSDGPCHEGGLLVEALGLAAEPPEFPWTLIFRERRPNFE